MQDTIPGNRINFIGSDTRSVDDRGRSPIPKRVRRILDQHAIDELILSPVREGKWDVVRIYTPALFAEVEERLIALNLSSQGEEEAYAFRAAASPCEIDTAGRILIPQEMRKLLELDREVVWSGHGRFIDLHHPTSFAAVLARPRERDLTGAAEIARVLRGG